MRLDASSQHPRHPNYLLESDQLVLDEDLLTSWQVFLRAEGKSPKTIKGYFESVRRLLSFTRAQGMPNLTNLRREHVAAWMDELRSVGNKPATIHTRYRGASAFYKWLIMEADEGIEQSPFAHIRPPRIPDEVQPHYEAEQLERTLRVAAKYPNKIEAARIRAIVVTLYDTGLRAQELCSLRTEDVNWSTATILVRETKGGDHRMVGLGANAARCVDTYLRKRRKRSGWLFETLAGRQLTVNALKLALRRAFGKAGVPFRGVHGFRRGFAIAYLANEGSPEDLKQLAGWRSHAMVARYTRADASRRALENHKLLSPGDRLIT